MNKNTENGNNNNINAKRKMPTKNELLESCCCFRSYGWLFYFIYFLFKKISFHLLLSLYVCFCGRQHTNTHTFQYLVGYFIFIGQNEQKKHTKSKTKKNVFLSKQKKNDQTNIGQKY